MGLALWFAVAAAVAASCAEQPISRCAESGPEGLGGLFSAVLALFSELVVETLQGSQVHSGGGAHGPTGSGRSADSGYDGHAGSESRTGGR